MSYDHQSDRITLRNPWGHVEPLNSQGQVADGRDDGIFSMSLAEFNQHFSTITYEE